MAGEHFFICYSAVDAAEFAPDLADRLEADPPSYPVWMIGGICKRWCALRLT